MDLLLPTLETERLVLRQLTLDDAPAYFEFSSDPEVTRFVSQPTHATLEETQQRISDLLESQAAGDHRQWGIILKETGKLIGACGLFGDSQRDKRAEMGYTVNRAYWNHGYMTEAVR